jgi:predicted acetyltransferase
MAPVVRPVREDELAAFFTTLGTAFLDRPDADALAADVRTAWDLDRTLGAFDGPVVAGTFRTWATELTVPGGTALPAAAVTAVSVRPTHRRRGILRAMVAEAHQAIRALGEPVAVLLASEYPIYGRFGYGPATVESTWVLDTRATTLRAEPGGVELVPPDEATREVLRAVFERWRARQAGEIRRRDLAWDLALGLRRWSWGPPWKGFVAVHRDRTGTADGYVRYSTEEKWEQRQPRGVVTVNDLHAASDEAYGALWRYLADIDWAATVRAERRHPAEPLPWILSNARAAAQTDTGDGLWVRLLDVPRALEARAYEGVGRLVLELADPGEGTRERVELDVTPDGARCRRSRRSADVTLGIAALGAAYLGGTRLTRAVLANGADEHRSGALATADRLLRTADDPWCTTFF